MSIKQHFTNAAFVLFGALPLSIARVLGRIVGLVLFLFNETGARTTQTNIKACFPKLNDNDSRSLAKTSMEQTGALIFETFVIWSKSNTHLQRKIKTIHGEALIQDAVKRKKGVIVLGPHLGNWEALGKVLPNYGRVTSLYQPPKSLAAESLIKKSRESSGAALVPTSTRGVLELLKSLKNGHISGILPDQVPNEGSGKLIPFFGIPAYTMTLVHKLQQKTDCVIIIGFAERVRGGFDIHFLRPDPDIYAKDIDVSLRAMNASIENAVKIAPSQYQWEYKRFKKKLSNGKPALDYR